MHPDLLELLEIGLSRVRGGDEDGGWLALGMVVGWRWGWWWVRGEVPFSLLFLAIAPFLSPALSLLTGLIVRSLSLALWNPSRMIPTKRLSATKVTARVKDVR
jgi:hypothetical protein